MYVCLCVRNITCTYICNMYLYMCVPMYVCMYVCIRTTLHTHVYTYASTHMYYTYNIYSVLYIQKHVTYDTHHIHTSQVLIDQTMQEYDLVEEYYYPLSDEDFDNRWVRSTSHMYVCTQMFTIFYIRTYFKAVVCIRKRIFLNKLNVPSTYMETIKLNCVKSCSDNVHFSIVVLSFMFNHFVCV